ncbi:hypothetical protein SUGI_0482360 [Cryptomeria japonica]|nr:hypothetical protein SUGI_0482360 [Cryptomeria japonica]
MANVIPTQTFQQANPVLNDQQIHEEHMLPFPTDLNQTTTMDAMQTRDGSDDTIMEDHERVKPDVSREIRVGYGLMGPWQLIGRHRRDGIAWDGGDRMEKAGMGMRQRAILSAA